MKNHATHLFTSYASVTSPSLPLTPILHRFSQPSSWFAKSRPGIKESSLPKGKALVSTIPCAQSQFWSVHGSFFDRSSSWSTKEISCHCLEAHGYKRPVAHILIDVQIVI